MCELLYGIGDAAALAGNASNTKLTSFPDLVLEQVQIYTSLFEIPLQSAMRRLPKGVHPSVPALCCVTFWRCPAGDLGPFELAFVGLTCRTGIKPRQLVQSAFASSEKARDFFRGEYGFSCQVATVRQRESYDRVLGKVDLDGKTILEMSTNALVPLVGMGSFVKYAAALSFARANGKMGLVQLEASYEFKRVIRGVPQALVFDSAALGDGTIAPVFPISGAHAIANLTLHPARYVVVPVRPAEEGGVTRIQRKDDAA